MDKARSMTHKRGFSLVEIMVVVAVVGMFFVVVSGTFYQFGKGIFTTKSRIVANNLAQEKVEILKNVNYYKKLDYIKYNLNNWIKD